MNTMTRASAVQHQIDAIMDSFEFNKVFGLMEDSNWVWINNGKSYVPCEEDLRATARELLHSVAATRHPYESESTGGFIASKEEDVDEGGPWIKLHLAFGVSSMNEGTGYAEDGQ